MRRSRPRDVGGRGRGGPPSRGCVYRARCGGRARARHEAGGAGGRRRRGWLMDVFRTPDERFEGLPGYDFEPHYAEVDGLRLHYVDESPNTCGSSASPAEPPRTNPIVCFHGEPTWAYL